MKKSKQDKRPSSDNFVDVHIFVVPHELWMEKYRTTYNNSTLESISAGFVRVAPVLSVCDLRSQIKEQLAGGDVLPEDYVFLRCVGRCLAIVSKAQEFSLKVKHFLPPIVPSPEIFVLSGTHESLSHSLTSSLNDESNPAEYVSGYLNYSREADDVSRCSTRSTGEVSMDMNSNDYEREGREVMVSGLPQRRVHFENGTSDTQEVAYNKAKDDVSDDFKDNTDVGMVSLEKDIGKSDRNSPAVYLADQPQQTVQEQPSRRYTPRSVPDRQISLQATRNIPQNCSENDKFQEQPKDTHVVSGTLHQELEKGPSTPQTQDNKRFPADPLRSSSVNPSNKTKRKNPLVHSKTAPALFEHSSNKIDDKKHKKDLEETDGRTVEPKMEDDGRSLVDENVKNGNIHDVSVEKDAEVPENSIQNSTNNSRPTSHIKSNIRTSGHGSSLPSPDKTTNKEDIGQTENDLGRTMADKENLVLQLQAELNAVRLERSNSEKAREQLMKKAKNLQNEHNQKRNQARNIWKRRYFEEKKITVSLEERCNQLRYEVDVLHKKLFSSLDSKDHEGTQGTLRHDGDPEKVNNKILLTRKENEVEELKRRVEEAKIKLGSEMKLRDTAQKELRQLRDEVIDKKINATLVKKSLSLLETRPGNT